jgi:glycerol-3-phosphate cytidylyltransferase
MKKIVIFGGSNGLGLEITRQLFAQFPSIQIVIYDVCKPEISSSNLTWIPTDFSKKYDIQDFYLPDADAVIFTAGIGRIDHFDHFGKTETDKDFLINALTPIEVIELYSKKLTNDSDFFFGVITSISALVSSPLFAIYSATKAALSKYVEAVNVELEKSKAPNRILDYCPGLLKGTKFYGGENVPSEIKSYAEDFLASMFQRTTWKIAMNDPVYNSVLQRYQKNPHQFGLSSYDYKMAGNRINPNAKITIGYMSGTFDLFHIGHLNVLKNAKNLCDYLVVGVHTSGAFKGKDTFISFEERSAIVGSIQYVDKVIEAPDDDMDYVMKNHPDFLFVGSDYKGSERFNRYEELLKNTKTKIIYFPYTKGTSSTKLRNAL